MAVQKFLQHDGTGGLEEVEATQTGGTASSGKIVALDVNGRITENMLPTGTGPEIGTIKTSEDLSAGDFVNVYNTADGPTVRKADATSVAKAAHGFVKEAFARHADATVFMDGNNDVLTGVTGGTVYLSTVAGRSTATAPSGSGQIVQVLGVGTSATTVCFSATNPIVLA